MSVDASRSLLRSPVLSFAMPNSVLVVDDEEGIRRTLQAVLEDEGLAVETASSGEECLASFERRAFSCVLLDVWLPGIDGIETLSGSNRSIPKRP